MCSVNLTAIGPLTFIISSLQAFDSMAALAIGAGDPPDHKKTSSGDYEYS